MKPFRQVSGPVTVLDRDDVDTDVIIPKQFLKLVQRTGFDRYLFYDWREEPGWELPVNEILVTGRNFGCGSSREHAVWALHDYGFAAILAPSFGDIFWTNCTKNGVLPVELKATDLAAIARAGEATVDLERQTVAWPTGEATFEIAPEVRERLLAGLDDIAATLQSEDAIASYEQHRRGRIPLTTR